MHKYGLNKATEDMNKTSMSDTCQLKKKAFAWILYLSYLTPEQPSPVAFFLCHQIPCRMTSRQRLLTQTEHRAVRQKGLLTNKWLLHKTTRGSFISLSWFPCHCIILNYVDVLHSCYGFSMSSAFPPSCLFLLTAMIYFLLLNVHIQCFI